MEWTTIVSMIGILGYVWGGFLFFLNKAYRKERDK